MRRLPLLVFLAGGCKAPDPAPIELDELAHFFFAQVHEQEHERIVEGAANLAAWFDEQGLEGPGATSGSLTDLVTTEVTAMEEMAWAPDPEPAVGVFALSELPCSLEQAEAVNLHDEQLELFPGSYKDYSRSYDGDKDCYATEDCDSLDWTAQIEDGFMGSLGSMTYRLVIKMRRSRDAEGQPAAMLVRSVMPEVAEEDYNAGGFEQSYHVGVYAPRGDGKSLHLSAMWAYGWVNGVDPDADAWANQYVEGLLDFEDTMEELCTEGW